MNDSTKLKVRRWLARKLGVADIDDRVWSFLERRGELARVLNGELPPADFADAAEDCYAFAGIALPDDEDTLDLGGTMTAAAWQDSSRAHQHEALEELAAALATSDAGVRAFRRNVLHDRLLTKDAVAAWVRQQAKRDGRPSHWMYVPLPDGHGLASALPLRLEPPAVVEEVPPGGKVSTELLEYGTPDTRHVQFVPTRAGGVLDRLRQLSEELADRYGWQPAQATVLILTGTVPELEPVSVFLRLRDPSRLSRIILTVDPMCSPKEVANAYQRARTGLVGRFKALTEKHLALALFTTHQRDDEDAQTALTRWNTEHSDWRYVGRSGLSNFNRDRKHAVQRLLGERGSDNMLRTWLELQATE